MGFNKEQAIIAQNSATAAATIVASLGFGSVEEAIEAFNTVRTDIFNGSLGFAGAEALVEGLETTTPRSTQRSGGGSRSNSGSGDSGAGVEVKFGKYNGKTLGDILATDPEYVEWLAESSNNPFIKSKAAELLAA